MHNLRLKQSLGQNFLRDKNIASKIANSIKVDKNAAIIEIGPGDGAITGLLLEKFRKVITVEIDSRFVKVLKDKFSNFKNLTIEREDFLKINLNDFYDRYGGLNVFGNLPYHITSPVLFKLFENRIFVESAYLMMQREVGNRILSLPNKKERGILSVLSQYYCKVTSLFNISKNVFYPIPKVGSSFIKFEFIKRPKPTMKDEKLFRNVVKLAFGKRRKYLRNSLNELENIDIKALSEIYNLNRRPEELSVEEFVGLSNKIYSLKGDYGIRKNRRTCDKNAKIS